MLETGKYDDSSPAVFKGTVLSPGATISGIALRNGGSTLGDTHWLVLGYNAAIPQYVKYRKETGSGYEYRWVSSLRKPGSYPSGKKYGLLGGICAGDTAYSRQYNPDTGDYDYAAVDTVTSVGEDQFVYGNNCTYSVPTRITTAAGQFLFAGYNVVIHPLATTHSEFFRFRDSDDRNRYGISDVRTALNDLSSQPVDRYGHAAQPVAYRMQDEPGFLQAVQKTVNRTWTHQQNRHINSVFSIDYDYCEHIVDKFWLLGAGNLNCLSADPDDDWTIYDVKYDTSVFRNVFAENIPVMTGQNPMDENKIRRQMGADGAPTGVNCYWWIRSAINYPGDEYSGALYGMYVDNHYNGTVHYWPTSSTAYSIVAAATIG